MYVGGGCCGGLGQIGQEIVRHGPTLSLRSAALHRPSALRRAEGQLTDQPTKLYDQRKDLIGRRRPTAICGVSEGGVNSGCRVRADEGRQNANSGLAHAGPFLGRFGPNRRSNHRQHTQREYFHAAASVPRPRSAHSPTQTWQLSRKWQQRQKTREQGN